MAQGFAAEGSQNAEVGPRSQTLGVDYTDLSPTELVEHVEYLDRHRDNLRAQERALRERQQEVLKHLANALDQVRSVAASDLLATESAGTDRRGTAGPF